jgi:hypothetical protein
MLTELVKLAMMAMAVAVAAAAAASGVLGASRGGLLLPCGNSSEVVNVFKMVNGVCEQRGEDCPADQPLPTSCASAECQRVVKLAADSCGPSLAQDGFLKTAYGPYLDAVVAVCAAAHEPADTQVSPLTPLCALHCR